MNAHSLGRAAAGLTTAVTLTLACGVGSASAASGNLTATQEDPTTSTYLGGAAISSTTLVGVGSDTTQDVEYGIAQDLGTVTDGSVSSVNIASWTATGTTPLTYRSGGAPATHPNGSGAGFTALEESIGLIPSGADSVGIGDVDFSRAASFQGNQITGGALTEIPFAYDSVTFVVPSGSPFLLTNGGHGLQLTDLAAIYTGTDTYVDTTNGDLLPSSTPSVSGDPTEPIQGYLPKPGSGVRQTFLKQLNQVNSAVPYGSTKGDTAFAAPYPSQTGAVAYVGAQTSSGQPVQQNDASVLEGAPAGVATIVPFSTAKFIGYHNGVIADPSGKIAGTDYTVVPFDYVPSGQTAATGTATPPYLDNSGTYAPSPAYKANGKEGTAALAFEAFNIVPTVEIANPNANAKSRAIYDTFAGSGSKFCLDTATIQAYGFLKDANCGNTSRTAGAPSAATVSVAHTAAIAGRSSVFTVGVQSVGNGGGSVTLTVNGHPYVGSIPAGATSTTFTVPTPTAGTFTYGDGASDGFKPNLAGVAAAPITPTGPAATYSVAKTTAAVSASAPTVSHLRTNGYASVRVIAPGLTPTGSVTVVLKTATGITKYSFAARTLSAGAAKVLFNKALAKGTYYVWVSYSGDSNLNAKPSARIATLTVL